MPVDSQLEFAFGAGESSEPSEWSRWRPVVYFIEAIGSGLVKIGYTGKLVQRLTELATASACELRVIKTMPGSKGSEAVLHRRFRAHRVRGEWFDLAALRPHIEALAGTLPSTSVCRDCGFVLSRRADRNQSMRCRRCSAKHRGANVRAANLATRLSRSTCVECGVALGNTHQTDRARTYRCRPCGMRVAWSTPEYRESIMAARKVQALHLRRKCQHCGLAEPKLRPSARYHPECWRAVLSQHKRTSSAQLGLI